MKLAHSEIQLFWGINESFFSNQNQERLRINFSPIKLKPLLKTTKRLSGSIADIRLKCLNRLRTSLLKELFKEAENITAWAISNTCCLNGQLRLNILRCQ